MGKLIFADSASNLKLRLPNWNKPDDPSFYSIAFTQDGYLITHGKEFSLSTVGEESDLVNLAGDTKSFWLTGKNVGSAAIAFPVNNIKATQGNPIVVTPGSGETAGEFTVDHGEVSGDTTGLSEYGATSSDYKLTIPHLYVDKFGHVQKISNGNQTAVNLVEQKASTGKFFLLGGSGSDVTAGTVYNSNFYVENGTLVATAIKEGSTLLANKYVQSSWLGNGKGTSQDDVKANGALAGIVSLVDTAYNVQDPSDATKGVAVSPKAVKEAYTKAVEAAQNLFASNDAMVFMGTLSATGIIQSHNNTVAAANNISIIDKTTSINSLKGDIVGWTFKFIDTGTITINGSAKYVETGDMLICINGGNTPTYEIIQSNIENEVVSENTTLDEGIVLSTGTGRTVKSFSWASATNGQALTKTANGLAWANVVNNWRPVVVNNNQILSGETTTNALGFSSSTGISLSSTDGTITITNTSPLSAASSLKFFNSSSASELCSFNPSNADAFTLKFEDGAISGEFKDSVLTVKHKKPLTSTVASGLYKIAVDTYGHITGTTAVTSEDLPVSAYSFSAAAGTNSVSYNNSANAGIKFIGGGDASVTSAVKDNILEVTTSFTNKYKKFSIQNSTDQAATSTDTDSTTGITLKAADANTKLTMSGSVVTIQTSNTWRAVSAYNLTNLNNSNTSDDFQEVLSTSIGTNSLKFGDEFAWDGDEIKLVWTEISGSTITYKA